MADPADDPDLRERVAQLEATVQKQQQTIHQLLPSRRRVLQAGGLVAGGGVLGALTADRASADVVGQVGTQQDRVDVFAGEVDANSVKTNEATIGNRGLYEDHSFNSVADDTAVSFDAKQNTNSETILEVTTAFGSPNRGGIFLSRFSQVVSGVTDGMTNQSTDTLNGGTGPDGSLNIARDGNTVYLENRTGENLDITVFQRAFDS